MWKVRSSFTHFLQIALLLKFCDYFGSTFNLICQKIIVYTYDKLGPFLYIQNVLPNPVLDLHLDPIKSQTISYIGRSTF